MVQVDSLCLCKIRFDVGLAGKKGFPPPIKHIIFIRDKLIEAGGSIPSATDQLSSWHLRGSSDTSLGYDFFRPMGQKKTGHRVVWNSINLLKFSFVHWLAVLGRLPTWTNFLSCRLIKLASCVTRWKRHYYNCFLAALLPRKFGNTSGLIGTQEEHVYHSMSLKWLLKES